MANTTSSTISTKSPDDRHGRLEKAASSLAAAFPAIEAGIPFNCSITSPGEATKIRSRRSIGPIVGTLLIAFSINHLT
jgi:hypothetical protein